jgi:hypothetical protein
MRTFSLIPFSIQPIHEVNNTNSFTKALNSGFWNQNETRATESLRFEMAELSGISFFPPPNPIGNNLYIALSNGGLAHLSLDLFPTDHHIDTKLENALTVISQKSGPCTMLAAIPTEESLIYYAGQTVIFLNMADLKQMSSLRGVSAFVLDTAAVSPMECISFTRRTFSVHRLNGPKNLETLKTKNISEPALVSLCSRDLHNRLLVNIYITCATQTRLVTVS